MKRISAFVVFLSVLGLVCPVYAHPPSEIKITFDAKARMLEAVIMHNTSNPSRHYIDKVNVGLNGKEVIKHLISREDDNVSQTARYLIPDAAEGDVISVEAYCSISGKLKKEITVKK